MTRKGLLFVLLVVGYGAPSPPVQGGSPSGTAFTYQGQFKQNGTPANGQFDFRFSLQTTQIGVVLPPPQCRRGVTVVNGLFTADVGFPPGTFVGPQFSLQVHVKPFVSNEIFDCIPNTFDLFTAVGPPQPIQPTPYAMFAQSASPGSPLDAPEGSPTDALIVDAGGDVGIGTLVPTSKLQVAGDTRSDGTFGVQARNPNNVSANAILGWLDDVARIRIGGAGVGVATMASVATSSTPAQFRALSTTTISFPTVNNQGFTYFIQATWGGSAIRLAGAKIEYTVTSLLP